MKMKLVLLVLTGFLLGTKNVSAQINENGLGAWYMYFYNTTFKESKWGVQGDIQYRNWNIAGDLEQLLLRSGVTYKPENANVKLTLGYGHITTGTYGSESTTSMESRIYQEALFPVKFGNRLYTNHRFRYEQRFVENQDFRTRYRYNLFVNVALNKPEMEDKTLYLALYNELFINGERSIGDGKSVEVFDRNRFYAGFGYILNEGLKVQFGMMRQTTDNWSKNQWQFSVHQKF